MLSIMQAKSGQQEHKAASRIMATVWRNEQEKHAAAQFPFSIYTVQDLSQEMVPSTVGRSPRP